MKYLLYLMPLFILSCNSRETDSTTNTPDTTIVVGDTALKVSSLEPIADLPPAIEGCSGLFSPADGKNSTGYVFVMDLQGLAYIKVNGKLIELTRTHKVSSDSAINESYKGTGVEITLNLLELERAGDELWIYSGELKLTMDAKTQQMNIKGEVGC